MLLFCLNPFESMAHFYCTPQKKKKEKKVVDQRRGFLSDQIIKIHKLISKINHVLL